MVASRVGDALVLRGTSTGAPSAARLRPWASTPDVGHLVFFHRAALPADDDLRRWLDLAAETGYTSLRTGAMAPAAAALVERHGFCLLQRLAMLAHSQPGAVRGDHRHVTSRLRTADHGDAAAVDLAAFGPMWGLDRTGIADAAAATTRSRIRGVSINGRIAGMAVSGRDGRVGFLQRLAVHPDAQRQGIGEALVVDSLRWSAKWRADRVLVNTHIDNQPALELYGRVGFRRLAEELAVYERALP